MAYRAALLLVALLVSACSSAEEDLLGHWEFDEATYELIQKYQSLPEAQKREWVRTATMDLSFKKDGTFVWNQHLPTWGEKMAIGLYEVVGVEGAKVTLEMQMGPKPTRMVMNVDGDRLRFGLGGRSIILKRKKGKEKS